MTDVVVNPFPRKPSTLLKWLLQGQTVEIAGQKWCLADDGRLGVLGMRYKFGNTKAIPGEVVLINDLPISEFIKLAESISDDQMFIIGANMVLTDINQGR